MKIAHLTSVHHARDTRILYKECSSLAQAGHQVHLVAYGASFIENNVQVVGLGEKPKNRLQRIFSGAKQVVEKGLSLDCDVYHLHDPELLPFIPKIKRAGKKVIFDSHEDVPQQILEKEWLPTRGLVSKAYACMERYYLRKTDAVIGVTPHLVDRLKKINSNTVMITNYPILDSFHNSILPNKDEKDIYICFAGRISRDWNHLSIIKALQQIEGVRYVLCGKPDNQDYLNTLLQADEKGVLDYRGIVNHDEIPALYSGALAGISWLIPTPNIGGELGTLGNNKLFEQMASGIPVIISDLKLWSEIIQRYHCGIIVKSGDVEGFKKAVNTLMTDRSTAKQMGKNGKRAVEQEYNWASQEKTLIEVYSKILDF
ncbi:MAG: glycosyltransferase family 4 protein [Christensenellales bacterium]|jgi:glycosyltransferase involved in cell wall biosynthesis